MLYKAKTSFAGPVTMYRGEEKQLSKKEAAPLLKCGYIEAVSKEQPEQADSVPEQQAETEEEQQAETTAE